MEQFVSIPIWPALEIAGTIIAAIAGTIVFAFMKFELKKDAETKSKAFDDRLKAAESILGTIGRDVSYIRGRLEPK